MIAMDPVAVTYAQALLEVGWEKGVADALFADLEAIETVLQTEPEVKIFLETPGIEDAERKRVIERLFRGKVHDATVNFLLVLTDHGRERQLSAIVEAAGELYREHEQQVLVHVRTPVEVSDKELEGLKKTVEGRYGRTCVFKKEVDPDILGGIVVRIGDVQVDASVRSRLTAMQRRFEQADIQKEAVYEA